MPLPPRTPVASSRPITTPSPERSPERPAAPRKESNAARFGYQKRTVSDIENKIIESSSSYKSYFIQKYKEFKPKDGENYIRILPPLGFVFPKHITPHYGISLYLHFLMTSPKATVICPKRTTDFKPSHIEDRCPICDDVARLFASGQAEKVKTLRLKAQKKTLVWVLDFKNTAEATPLLFGIASTLDLGFIKLCKDRSTGEIYNLDDPDFGFNIYFDKTKEFGGTKYVGEAKDSRPSAVDASHLEFVLANPLPSVLLWRGYDELHSLYGGEVASSIGDEAETIESDNYQEQTTSEGVEEDLLSHYDTSF